MAADNKTGLMALGSAAVLGVYGAGWFKTKDAADRFAAEATERRPPAPSPTEQPRVQAVLRVTKAAPNVGPARLRAGASAAEPSLPAITRTGDTAIAAMQALPTTTAATQSASQPPVATAATVGAAPAPAAPRVIDAAPTPSAATVAAPVSAPVSTPVSTPVSAPVSAPSPAAAKPPEPAPRQQEIAGAKWKDGTYYGWGTSRHGDIQAAVIIQSGRIVTALVSQCLTQYSCSWIAALPPQVVGRQSAEVDYVSGATQSTNAFYYAVQQALTRAK